MRSRTRYRRNLGCFAPVLSGLVVATVVKVAPDEYKQRVVGFFDAALLGE